MKIIKQNKDGIMILIPFMVIILFGIFGIFDLIFNFIYLFYIKF